MGAPGERKDPVRAAAREGRLLHPRRQTRRRGERPADSAARDRRGTDRRAAARDRQARGHLRGGSSGRGGPADELLPPRPHREADRQPPSPRADPVPLPPPPPAPPPPPPA